MKRRRYLAGLVAGSVAGGLGIGSGAFSSAEADRLLSVETAHDNDAYLGLRQLGGGYRSIESGTPEQVEFSIPGLTEDDTGLGTNSVYEFVYDDQEDTTPGLLAITNQGTNDVEVYSEHETESELEIEMFDVTDSNRTALTVDPPELSPGDEPLHVGFRIKTFSSKSDTYEENLTIIAKSPEI